jgi:hypothetical protein
LLYFCYHGYICRFHLLFMLGAGVYQNGQITSVLVTLTDGRTRSGTPALASSNTAVATVSGTTVTSLSAGISTITATYASATGLFIAYVNATGVGITAMSLTYGSSTLSGQTGVATLAGSVSVTFSDGTNFANAVASFSPLTTLLAFNSSDPRFVTVSSTGVASLVNNSWKLATLTAFSKCSDRRTSSYNMAGNLAAVTYDTKLGSTTGLTFPAKTNGQTVDATLRVQVGASAMTTYQVWVFYNNLVFGPPTIAKGSGWPTGAFASSVGNPVAGNIVKAILSFSSGSSATNSLVLHLC